MAAPQNYDITCVSWGTSGRDDIGEGTDEFDDSGVMIDGTKETDVASKMLSLKKQSQQAATDTADTKETSPADGPEKE